ncbi:DUF1905 domain-containing protein [Qipengyuania marisflavi]|uniref:DUF1905 domain-containing protein n=2 Tax=Qipengyuania marisflavi TaxID=2486356 RepID=A0A5S3P1H5_9SPHN|nr:DUF1905 domain-containing protein [Qipengyuania marisflavi]
MWRWTAGNGVSWHFLTIAGEAGESISAIEAMWRLELGKSRGFRSVKVQARIGETKWSTSCFPNKEGGWLLPVKAAVRKAEGIAEGDEVRVALDL